MRYYKCIHRFDPCYGFKIIQLNEVITVQDASLWDRRIIACSNNDTFPGAGYRVSQYELEQHFVEVDKVA